MNSHTDPTQRTAATSPTTTHERNVLIIKLLVVVCLLTGPLSVFIGIVIYAMHRSEQAHPSSHRSVASAWCEADRSA
jgi:hypothetical protein